MKFTCDRCQKRFSTTDEPVPGRVYRVPCRCGNTIVVQLEAAEVTPSRATSIAPPPRRGAPPPLPLPARAAQDAPAEFPRPPAVAAALGAQDAAVPDDPFARADAGPDRPDLRVLLACASEEVTPTILARRDPDAPLELSSAYAPEPTIDPFADALHRTRTHALALGGAAGAAVGAVCAAVMALLVLRPWSPVSADTAAPPGELSAAQLSSHRGPVRPVAARRVPARAAAPSGAAIAAVSPSPAGAVAPAPPAPSPAEPAASARGRGAVAPASLDAARAPERVEAAAEAVADPDRSVGLDAREEPASPTEPPAAAVEDAPAAAPAAEAPAVPDAPAASPAIAAGAPDDAPAPAREP